MRFHESALSELDASHASLQDRLEDLARDEARLVEHLQRLHAKVDPSNITGGQLGFSAADLGRSAALSADLLLSMRAATGTAPQPQPQRAATAHAHADDSDGMLRDLYGDGVRSSVRPQLPSPRPASAAAAAPPRTKHKPQKVASAEASRRREVSASAVAVQKPPREERRAAVPTLRPAAPGDARCDDSIERQIDELSARIRRRLDVA